MNYDAAPDGHLVEREWALAEARREVDELVDRVGLNAFLDAAYPKILPGEPFPRRRQWPRPNPEVIFLTLTVPVAAALVGLGAVTVAVRYVTWRYVGTFTMAAALLVATVAYIAFAAWTASRAYDRHAHTRSALILLVAAITGLAVAMSATYLTWPPVYDDGPGNWWNAYAWLCVPAAAAVFAATIHMTWVAFTVRANAHLATADKPCGFCNRPISCGGGW